MRATMSVCVCVRAFECLESASKPDQYAFHIRIHSAQSMDTLTKENDENNIKCAEQKERREEEWATTEK